ncbi:hypothetical protein TNCV_3295731 [Trichonephila clavipes]|uniref:Uncharacterized protein n=1 Tax=Trichonephila clavipes TaxID=2585209 RepID=A0A8X6SXN3_TRICX|nr:hypothetical protein TNCV_3295731 [Trichonephila clavipes]
MMDLMSCLRIGRPASRNITHMEKKRPASLHVCYPEVTELFIQHKFYQVKLQHSECEYGTLSLSPCTSLGYTVNGTPPASPTKSLKDYPALPKINSNKRKESDHGFISPSRSQTIKKPNLILNPTFTLETANTLANLNEKDISGTSSSQTITHDNNTAKNTLRLRNSSPHL